MTYEIGQKVMTPLGVGIIYTIQTIKDQVTYKVEFEKTKLNFLASFVKEELKPYKTPHERLIEMGFEYLQVSEDKDDRYYNSRDGWIWFSISNKNYRVSEDVYVDLELSRILTDYLEWLEEEK